VLEEGKRHSAARVTAFGDFPMILDTAAAQSLLYGFVLILSIWGAIADWRYKREGGKQPSKKEKALFLSAVILAITLFAVLAILGAGEEMIEDLTPPIAIILLATWELGRWRVRRTNPLEESEQSALY
jgi:hypothetical protein